MVKAVLGLDFAQNGKSTRGSSKTVKVWPPPGEASSLLGGVEVLAYDGRVQPPTQPRLAARLRLGARLQLLGGAEERTSSDAWSASQSGGSSPESDE